MITPSPDTNPQPGAWSPTEGRVQVLNSDGSVAHDSGWRSNFLTQEGEGAIIDTFFRGVAAPANHLCLINQAGIDKTATLATMTEAATPGANGYNRQAVSTGDWAAPALDAGDMQSQAAQKTFGMITTTPITVTHVGLATVATGTAGKLLLAVPLAASTPVAVGQSLLYTLRAKVA